MPEAELSRLHRLIWLLAIVAVVLIGARAAIGSPLEDGFHEGEYLSSRFYFAPGAPVPVLIHGMMDVIPARLAIGWFGLDRAIAGTRLINALLGMMAGLLFLATLARIARTRAGAIVALACGSGAMLVMAKLRWGVVSVQQGAPAIRDVFALGVLLLILQASRERGRRHDLLTALAGLVVGGTLFWAYNRGLAVGVALGTYLAVRATGDRSLRAAWPGVAGLASGLASVWAMSPAHFAGHFGSILYWQSHGGLWTRFEPGLANYAGIAICAAAVVLPAIAGLAQWLRAMRRDKDASANAALILGLTAAAALILLSSLNRFDDLHVMMFVPYAILALAAALPVLASRVSGKPSVSLDALKAACLFVAVMVVMTGVGNRHELGANLRMAMGGALPSDAELASPDDLRIAGRLRASGGNCTFAFDNRGAFHHLSGLPPCSRFMIPAYVGRDAEAGVLIELQRHPPAMIVMRSGFWSWTIDGIAQDQRTPQIASWLQANYQAAEVIGDTELARLKPGGD